VPVIKQMSP